MNVLGQHSCYTVSFSNTDYTSCRLIKDLPSLFVTEPPNDQCYFSYGFSVSVIVVIISYSFSYSYVIFYFSVSVTVIVF